MDSDTSLILSWKNISGWTKPTYKAPKKKKLLNNVSGIAKSGGLTAVISPSGGGKTTLLAILGGRYKGNVEGEVLINGHLVTRKQISNISGFVCQKNELFEDLTVGEHLQFMARMKMDMYSSELNIQKNVMKVVEKLVLTHRMNVKLKSLSGGQVKRLALAAQLLIEPKILFCDEPTTGLDSYNAVAVIKLLRQIADQGKMIVCAIHQPASGVFEMFDNVSVLSSNGSLAYYGAVDNINDYFTKLNFKCPENYNLCEFIVAQVTVRPHSVFKEADNDRNRAEKLVEDFHKSKVFEELENELSLVSCSENEKILSIIQSKKHHRQVGFNTQLSLLLRRSGLLLRRSWKTWALRFLLYLFVYSCLSFPYGKIKLDQAGVQNIQGLLNCLQLELLYASMYGVIYVVPEQLSVFIQESADHVYSPLPYYLSHVFILTTKALFEAFIFANFAFTITGINTTLMDFVLTVRPVLLLATTASAYGFFLSTAFDSITTASLFSVPFELICNVFSGLYIRLRSLPPYIQWMKYLSFSYYTYEALSVNEWAKYNYIYCDRRDQSECYLNGDQVLASYGFSRDNLFIDYMGLSVYTVVLLCVGYAFLLRQLRTIAAY